MTIRLISDIHLSNTRPDLVEAFFYYLDNLSEDTQALYLLGDIFDAYIGDDDDNQLLQAVKQQLLTVSQKGVKLYFMHGNRDFLVGEDFCKTIGCTLLSDPSTIEHMGKSYLLMHGDSLCTDDIEYQAFRTQIQSSEGKAFLLSKSLEERRAIAKQLRENSKSMNSNKAEDIMDVNNEAVLQAFAEHKVDTLIHGHTHRPAIHNINEQQQRIVLGDWDKQGWEVVIAPQGLALNAFDIIN